MASHSPSPHNDADGIASCLERRSTEAANRTKPPPTSIGVRDYRYPTRNLQRYPQTTAWRHCYHVLFLTIYRPRAGIKATVLAHLGYTNVRALLSPKVVLITHPAFRKKSQLQNVFCSNRLIIVVVDIPSNIQELCLRLDG